MLTATQGSVRFATVVGVAPSTTTMQLGSPTLPPLPSVMQSIVPGHTAPDRVYKPSARYAVPYASIEDLRSANPGLGIINESDAWLTGRPYGLPGTVTVELVKRPGGYGNNPNGHHYNAQLRDAGTDTVMQLQLIAEAQKRQQEALQRIAFWQAMAGGLTLVGIAAGLALAFFKD